MRKKKSAISDTKKVFIKELKNKIFSIRHDTILHTFDLWESKREIGIDEKEEFQKEIGILTGNILIQSSSFYSDGDYPLEAYLEIKVAENKTLSEGIYYLPWKPGQIKKPLKK